MAPTPLNSSISKQHGKVLLGIAKKSIKAGLEKQGTSPFVANDYPTELTKPGASFVTLKLNAKLKGCVGSLESHRPLAQDIAENAYNAAFSDPRFPPVSADEWEGLHIHLSILTPPKEIRFNSEASLRAQLNPHLDGIIIQEGDRKATFLPAVWQSLPDPRDFLSELKQKAGLPSDYWSAQIKVFRYHTESIE